MKETKTNFEHFAKIITCPPVSIVVLSFIMDTDGQFGRPLTNFKGTIRQTKVLRCALPRPFAIILVEENILFNKVKYPRGGQSNFKLRKKIT